MLVNSCLVGKEVRINKGGPESKVGILLAVKTDYLALLTKEDGIVYYQSQHVKSVITSSEGGRNRLENDPDAFLIKADTFQKLLEKTELKSVQINRGGPEKVEGVVCKVTDKTVILIHNKEIIRVSIFHIKNISISKKKEEGKENEKNENKKEGKSEGKGDSWSQKNQWAYSSTDQKWVLI
jgi:spore coat protein B